MNHSPEFTQYLSTLPEERQLAMGRLIETIRANIPRGFEEAISYGMPGWVVPHTHYAAGYHVDPTLPLPFVSLGYRKTTLAYTTWASTPARGSWTGLCRLTRSTARPDLTWGKAASVSRMSTTFPMTWWDNSVPESPLRTGLNFMNPA